MSSSRPLYDDRRWRSARAAFLSRNPLCVLCQSKGRTVGATHVDHVRPHRGNVTAFWDQSNWQPLCRACHAVKSRQERISKRCKYTKKNTAWECRPRYLRKAERYRMHASTTADDLMGWYEATRVARMAGDRPAAMAAGRGGSCTGAAS